MKYNYIKKIPHELSQNSILLQKRRTLVLSKSMWIFKILWSSQRMTIYFSFTSMINYTISFPHLTNIMSSSCLTRGPYVTIYFVAPGMSFATLAMTLYVIARSPFMDDVAIYTKIFLLKFLRVFLLGKLVIVKISLIFLQCSTWYSFFEFLVTVCVAW